MVADYSLPDDVYIGFTGRTGGATNNHWARNIQFAVGAIPPPAGGGDTASCDGGVCGTIDQVATDGIAGMTTYSLGIDLPASAANVYTIFGDTDDSMTIPGAYQEAAPFGANTGGVNPAFLTAAPTAAYDSWLTVGLTSGDAAGALGSIGIDWDSWTASSGLSVDNGAVFWMSPAAGPSSSAALAQITATTGSMVAVINAQGRSASGEDWQARGLT